MPDTVAIRTGSRLHLGLLAHGMTDGPNHGGCGLVLEEPGFTLRLERSTSDRVTTGDDAAGGEDYVARVVRVLDRVRSCRGISWPAAVHVERVVPRHAGLGSGTQLAAAVVQGLATLDGETERLTAAELAERTGRGHRSAVGLHGFVRGGFLVDRGHRSGEKLGELAERIEFPLDWRVLLVMPGRGEGLANEAEAEAFARLPPTLSDHVASLWRLVDERMTPALRAGDFGAFSQSVYEYGRRVGESFAAVQGGTYSHASTARIVDRLRESGVEGVGQTSWGPTVFAFAESPGAAERIAGELSEPGRLGFPVDVTITSARSSGAGVSVL